MKESNYYDKVFNLTKKIPKGRVTTYGLIADYLALGSARMVGWALNKIPSLDRRADNIPAHRVVNRKGELSGRTHFGEPNQMAQLLIDEGVKIQDNKIINFESYLWSPIALLNEGRGDGEVVVESIADWMPVAQKIIEKATTSKKVYFVGDLGVGKTTLIKLILENLGVNDLVTSPTFPIVNEYEIDGAKLYHMDLYRISTIEELFELGFEEYIDGDSWCFIEWPQIAESLLEDGLVVEITLDNKKNRLVKLS